MFFLPTKYAGQMLSEVSDISIPAMVYIEHMVNTPSNCSDFQNIDDCHLYCSLLAA